MPLLPSTLISTSLALGLLATAGEAFAQASLGPDAAHGKILFQQSCALCHSTGVGTGPAVGQGPLLAGVVGRRAASLSNFGYTKALTDSHLTWNAETLEKFLASPTTVVPGTNMVIAVADAKDRADVVAYLGTLRAITVSTADRGAPPARHNRTDGDWENDAPGATHRIVVDQFPAPYASKSVGNSPRVSDRPANAKLSVPKGFEVKEFASGLKGPRLLRTAPNGDIFIAETREGQIRVLRAPAGAEAPTENSVFAKGLDGPFGIAFYPVEGEPKWIYVGNHNNVVRFPYKSGDLKASGPAEIIVPRLAETTGGHSTRDVAFSLDGKKLFISVGSGSNVADDYDHSKKSPAEISEWEATRPKGAAWGSEANRADVLVGDPDGKHIHIFATGIRNAVGLAVQPVNGELWVSTNERDGLGDDLVPDYISHIKEGGYYGWPWYYWGNHEDPRRVGERPDLAGKAIVPDVPIQSHSASLQMTFYPVKAAGASAFPKDYSGDIFAALHGSWNRTGRTGSKVVRVHLKNGVASGEYEDFLTGFVIDDGHVWGRPVGVTVAQDGALLVTEDGGSTVWRVSYKGNAN